MDKQKYFSTHPGFEELDVPNPGYKIQLITPDSKFAQESFSWVIDREVGKYMGEDFSAVSIEGEKKRIQEIIDDTDGYNWQIECDNRIVGNINIGTIKETSEEFGCKAGSINYILGDKNLWGQGIMSSVIKVVLNWAFTTNDFELIKARAVPQNKGSIALLKKAGFKEYGEEEYDGPAFGEETLYITYKLTKDRWLEEV